MKVKKTEIYGNLKKCLNIGQRIKSFKLLTLKSSIVITLLFSLFPLFILPLFGVSFQAKPRGGLYQWLEPSVQRKRHKTIAQVVADSCQMTISHLESRIIIMSKGLIGGCGLSNYLPNFQLFLNGRRNYSIISEKREFNEFHGHNLIQLPF